MLVVERLGEPESEEPPGLAAAEQAGLPGPVELVWAQPLLERAFPELVRAA